jgi:hypothetical protein
MAPQLDLTEDDPGPAAQQRDQLDPARHEPKSRDGPRPQGAAREWDVAEEEQQRRCGAGTPGGGGALAFLPPSGLQPIMSGASDGVSGVFAFGADSEGGLASRPSQGSLASGRCSPFQLLSGAFDSEPDSPPRGAPPSSPGGAVAAPPGGGAWGLRAAGAAAAQLGKAFARADAGGGAAAAAAAGRGSLSPGRGAAAVQSGVGGGSGRPFSFTCPGDTDDDARGGSAAQLKPIFDAGARISFSSSSRQRAKSVGGAAAAALLRGSRAMRMMTSSSSVAAAGPAAGAPPSPAAAGAAAWGGGLGMAVASDEGRAPLPRHAAAGAGGAGRRFSAQPTVPNPAGIDGPAAAPGFSVRRSSAGAAATLPAALGAPAQLPPPLGTGAPWPPPPGAPRAAAAAAQHVGGAGGARRPSGPLTLSRLLSMRRGSLLYHIDAPLGPVASLLRDPECWHEVQVRGSCRAPSEPTRLEAS